ncbi:MAG: glucodextranase DOMON-like domain-containing protein [Frankiaceae bacterium]
MRRTTIAAVVIATVAPLLPGSGVAAVAASAAGATGAAAAGVAPGAPGATSYYDVARKDCVGTAASRDSTIWFTVADGVLSDVYEPTVDTTNVKTLQYAVTDGRSWTELQSRDLRYAVSADPSGMACTVTSTSSAHGYRIVTTYVADPARDAIVMRTKLIGGAGLRLFARLDPLIGGNGGGGSDNGGADSAVVDTSTGARVPVAYDTNTVTQAANRDYGVPTYAALRAAAGFSYASVGYAGTASDGLAMLDGAHLLTGYASAPDGHVALTARVRLSSSGEATLALGFGRTKAAALQVAGASATTPFATTLVHYLNGWYRYDAGLRQPSGSLSGALQQAYYRSVNVVKASEDKTYPGAIAAGLASPWGQAISAAATPDGKANYFGSYREVFARDLYEAFTGLLVAGDRATARDATRFLFIRQQQADGSMPRNSLLNGLPAPDTGGIQLDETSYPLLMAWQSGLTNHWLYVNHVRRAADFVVAHGPSFGVERWEEQSGYSPSTIAAEIAGLTAAARIAALNGDDGRSRVYQATADDFARHVKGWTVTTTGPYAPRYFIRLSKTGDPDAAVSYGLGNGGPTADQRSVVDAGFLELVRLGILRPLDTDVQASIPVVDKVIRRSTPTGDGFYRYGTDAPGSEDGYGDCYEPDPTSCSPSGAPWPTTNTGSGHLWPVLAGERAEQALSSGHPRVAATLLASMQRMASGVGLEPEQAWEDPPLPAAPYGSDPATASIGFRTGHPAGSASPLTWAQAQYARLARAIGQSRPLEQPRIVVARYVSRGMPGALPLTVTAPADQATVSTATVTVSGTTAAGAHVDVASASTTSTGAARVVSTTAGSNGHFSVTAPAGFGTTILTITATLDRRTAYAQRTVNNASLPGTTVLSVTDPMGDDNGPGTYAYPTSTDFVPGSFDLTAMKVAQTGTDVYVQLSLRELTETFGNPIGAQLFDLYVRDPAVSATSTAAAFPSRNYTIATSDAWSQRIEVQGFATPVWVDAAGNGKGTVSVIPSLATNTVTLRMPQAAFGMVGSGWTFVVTLHGQDGFSPDQARGFAPTPQPFQFGLCATAGNASPICAIDPGSAPKVMDTITPAGVSQATELDPTQPPVTLRGVRVS